MRIKNGVVECNGEIGKSWRAPAGWSQKDHTACAPLVIRATHRVQQLGGCNVGYRVFGCGGGLGTPVVS